MQASQVLTYAHYELVDESWDPEYKTIVAGAEMWKVLRRWVHSRTWEATLAESQAFPGPVNPGNLSKPWRMQSCTCGKTLSQPLSKRAVETWVEEGKWEVIEEYSSADDYFGISSSSD